MYFLRRKLDFNSLNTIIRFYSLARKTHYDVLKLRKNCTDKEIKEAFIQMSKEYHPDKNKDSAAQEKFVRIVEAYNVLSKPGSRARYDSINETSGSTYVYKTHVPYNIRRSQQSYYYENPTQKTQSTTDQKAYYGMSGVKKVPNYVIILMCCGLALVGVFVQVFVISELYVVQRRQAHEKSKFLAEELERVRSAAQGNGNDVQSRLLLEKIVTAANPTVATASLGQALASEKKDAAENLLNEFGIKEMTADEMSCNSHRSFMEDNRGAYSYQRWYLN
ncbi:dnaJ-like protein 60 isoform X1 [Ostrinia nubilalis]|uniref:dnaJ-like protein 60 isoform X1 n=2 Tax=Ostrinia nubilalis TaxID=29057 RepID=UPI0030822C76